MPAWPHIRWHSCRKQPGRLPGLSWRCSPHNRCAETAGHWWLRRYQPWAEAHHDVELENEAGPVLARRGCRRGSQGSRYWMSWSRSIWIRRPSRIGWWSPLRSSLGRGCRHCWPPAMWCLRSTRCRWPGIANGIPCWGAKSDAADAHLLAEIVRLDRAHHRRIAGDSEIAEHIKIGIGRIRR
jgi:hypothetical protein